MRQVWKYPIETGESCIEMPEGAQLLFVDTQSDLICLWALVDPDATKEKRHFMLVGTGHDVPDQTKLDYIGSGMLFGGQLVFHVFEVLEPSE